MTGDSWFHVEVDQRNPGQVADDKFAQLKGERESILAWAGADDGQRQEILDVTRAALIRLLEDPFWIPSSIRPGAGRLEVRIIIETDDPGAAAVARSRRKESMEELRATLLEIASDLAGRL